MTTATRTFLQPSLALAVGAACALSVSSIASAADASAANGLMKFEHVQVVNLADTPIGKPADSSAPAMRAFVDPATGSLRQPSPEELQTIANQDAAKSPAQARSLRAAAPQVRSMNRVSGKRVMLDESTMQFMVVKRFDDGLLVEDCVMGEAEAAVAAHQLTRESSPVRAQGESQ